MKKILLIAFLFVSAFVKAQITPLPKASTTFPYGLLDVRSFGAVGDSSTDNTTAFRAAFAEAYRYHTGIFIPTGNWVISDSILVGNRLSVLGAGGSTITTDEGSTLGVGAVQFAQTNILCRGNNKSGFVVSPADTGNHAIYNTGTNFKGLAIKYQGTTPTTNVGIKMVDGGSYTLDDVSIDAFWIDMDVPASAYPSITNCTFTDYANIGFRINNSVTSVDAGGTMITNSRFLAGGHGYTSPYAGLVWNGAGAFRMTNCEFNITALTHVSKYCIVLDNSASGFATQEIYITNTSLSAFDSCALFASRLASLTKGIFLDNLLAYGPITDSCNQAAFQIGAISGALRNVTVSHLTAEGFFPNKVALTVPVAKFTNVNSLHVSGLSNGQYYTGPPAQYINCQSSGAAIENDGVNTGMTDASGTPIFTRIKSNGELDLFWNDSVAVGPGPNPLLFRNGQITAGKIFGTNQWVIGNGNPSTVFFTTPSLTVEKDTNTRTGQILVNTNGSSSAGVVSGLYNGTNFGGLWMLGTGASTYKNLAVGGTALYSSASAGAVILADGGAVHIGNTNGDAIFVASTGGNVGINNITPGGLLDIGGSTVNEANNGTAGNFFLTRGNIIQNNTSAINATVAHYAVNAHAVNSLFASNTGITYTNASNLYIAGAPTAGTNVTITNPWALYVNAGKSFFGGTLSLNAIPSGTGTALVHGTDSIMRQMPLSSGTYTPTITNIANTSGTLTGEISHWHQVGNEVFVSGSVHSNGITSANVLTEIDVSLPVASTLAATFDCTGTVTVTGTGTNAWAGGAQADITNHKALIIWTPTATGATDIYFSIAYTVL